MISAERESKKSSSVSLDYLKQNLRLSRVAEQLRVTLLPSGTQNCIFCHGNKKLITRDDRYYKCYSPSCAKKGTVIDLVIDRGAAKDVKEAYRVLLQCLDGEERGRIEKIHTFESSRADLLERIFKVYQKGLDGEDAILELLNDRGYCHILESQPIGFAKGNNFIRENSIITSDDLAKVGLLSSSSSDEFFRNRVIFPVRNNWGRLVHLQGRSIEPDAAIRWLSSSSSGTIPEEWRPRPISEYIFGIHLLQEGDTVFLTEGISDCLSLLELDINAIACFGVEVNLTKHTQTFSRLKSLIAFFDNDVYPLGNQYAGQFKSWRSILPNLINLKEACPQLDIWCVMPPNESGIKDINDWLIKGVNRDRLLKYVKENALQLEDFALDMWGKNPQRHYDLIQLIGINKQPHHLNRLREAAENLNPNGFDWLEYCFKVNGL